MVVQKMLLNQLEERFLRIGRLPSPFRFFSYRRQDEWPPSSNLAPAAKSFAKHMQRRAESLSGGMIFHTAGFRNFLPREACHPAQQNISRNSITGGKHFFQ